MEDTYSHYLGKKCPYCKTEFIEGDEIVICSDCEMPHHKECFIENKGCTTFGCQGCMKSIVIISEPVIDIQVLEGEVKEKIKSIDETAISNEDEKEFYKKKILSSIYDEIVSKLALINIFSNNINDLIIVNKLISEFEKIRDFGDVKQQIELAIQKKINIANYLLNTTNVQINQTDKISLIKIAIRRYEAINNLTGIDVTAFNKSALERIEYIKKENEIKEIEYNKKATQNEKEKKENEALKKKNYKFILIDIFGLIICLLIYCCIKLKYKTNIIYKEALNYFNEGNYYDAMVKFENCKNYLNSEYYVEYCEKMIHYINGKDLVKQNKYETALKEFELAGEIEDTLEFIKYCNEKLTDLGE